VAPRTDLERELAQVWAEVLGRDQVGVADNFFALGGDSILIVQVASRARRRGIAVTPAQVFAHQTVAELARVAGRAGDAVVEAEQGEVTGEIPVTPAQAWFHGLALPHPDHWNLPVLLVPRRPVPAGRLAGALAALVAHHDALRLRVTIDDQGRPRHRIVPVAEHGPVPVDELSDLDALPRLQAGLDLARGPLLRAAVLPDRLLLVAHHLVVDAVSWRVLLADLATVLDQLAAGEPVRLPAKTTDLGQWARRLAALAGDPDSRERQQRVPDLPDDDPAAPDLEGDAELVEVALDEPASQDLLAPANLAYRTRTEELLLAGLARAAAEWSGRPGLLVDVEGHGRDAIDDADVTRTVGWFTTFTPTWLDLSDADGVDGLVKSTKEQLRARQRPELPRPQVSFNYLGRIDQPLNGFALAPEPVGAARHPANPRPYLIDVVAGIRDGRLRVYLGYSARHHSRAAMQRLAGAYLDALRSIVAHCRQPGAGGPTPSDFPLAQVDQRQLDRLVERHDRIEDLYPLTPLQRGLLFHTLANPGSGVYFEQFSLRLDGPLDLAAFTGAWTALLARHAVLRAGIAWQGLAAPHLVVHDHAELPLAHHDWRDLDEPARERRLAELLAGDRTTGFDLTRAPLTRLLLVRLAGERWQLVWSHHHIILDGWSVALLIQEVFDSYEAIRAGRHRPGPPPPPFRDYLAYLSGLDHAAAWSHWRRVLSGVTGPTPLGADRTAKPTASLAALDRSDATDRSTGRRDADYGRVYRRLPATHSDAVREFTRVHQLTLDTVLHGAWALALAHRSGHDDVIFGVTSAGRPPALSGVEDMVGLFINTLPARVRVRREQPVLAWLAGLLRDQVRTREYEHTPLDQIRGWTSVPPDRPLFDSGRGLENYPMDGSRFRTGSVTISDIRTFEQSNYALSFVVVPDEALSLQLWYDAARFAPETADHLLRAAETLVRGLAADPDRTVGEVLDLVPALARHPEPSLDTDRLACRLGELPLVREAVVRPAADGRRLTAYLVPDPGAGDGLADRHVAAWQSLYDQTYAAGGATTDPTRHFVGWNSSYTGEPIPAEAMAEWRAGTIARIRALRPARVLEIGCGTGLLLTGLLDSCERYLGTDFSAVCLAQVRAHLATRDPATRGAVTLRQQAADDPTGLEPGGFDVVILNSVVQYFPGTSYLERVLEVALRAAAPGGAVFLGDLRHHGLLAAFHTSVELHRAADLLPAGELHRRVSRSLAREQELLLDPAYLTGLPARRPEVGAVTVLPRLGRHDNELTRYRYDAVLRLGPPPPPPEAEWYDWHRDVLSRSEIGWLLEHAGGDAVGITGIPNARVTADVTAAQLLAGGDGPATAGELRLAAGKAPSGMDPEELYQLGERQGWSVTVSWAVRHPDGSLNALFQRGMAAPAAHELAEAGEPDEPATGGPLTNPPLRSTLATELERQARAALADHPGDLSVLVLDELPRTAGGELDVAALPPPPDPLPEVESAAGGTVPARTADELRLARIWEQALGTGAVDVRTSFFDLGGDSLLAIRVIDEAARALGRDIPLATLLQRPTIEGMATALHAEPRPWTPLVEITGGDGPPFFCVHPAGGNVLCYADLARLLAPRPFCALQARGVEGGEPPYGELPAMAARYLADVRARQPAGPYLLGGWSMGGLVAYEMAQQLVADGATVELLVMVETPTPELVGELPDEAAALARLLDGVVPLSPARLRAMPPADRLRYVLAEAERAQAVPPDQDRAQRLWDVYTTHLAAFRRYRPRPYAGRSLLLRAADTPIAAPDYGWGPLLTGQWEAVEVPGSHESVVWPPHVHRLAEVLRTRLTGRT
jgi:non-ribosomal peptide synthase protein (TIGR01720 family)